MIPIYDQWKPAFLSEGGFVIARWDGLLRARAGAAHLDRGAHPRVNAALIMYEPVGASMGGSTASGDEEVVRTGRLWNQVVIFDSGAFRGGRGIARKLVQRGYESATEFLDFGEGVGFSTEVGDHERIVRTGLGGAGAESPRAGRFLRGDFSDEAIEGDEAGGDVAFAGALAEYSVEGCGVTVVEKVDVKGPTVVLDGLRRCRNKPDEKQEYRYASKDLDHCFSPEADKS